MGVEVEVFGDRLDPRFRFARCTIQQVVGGDEVFVDGVAQVGEVNAAERAVPVGAVALAAIQFGPGLFDQLAVDRISGGGGQFGSAASAHISSECFATPRSTIIAAMS